MDNQTIMQFFEWNMRADGILWRRAANQAPDLKRAGIDIVWLPPAYKGAAGAFDVGYGVYDTYDLGEFDQKGSVRTKYGTKDEYLACVKALQKAGIAVMADVVLNHRMGADATESVKAEEFDPNNRLKRISGVEEIAAWTKYTFPGRAGKYSKFTWDWTCFTGIDWDERSRRNAIYQFAGKEWDPDVDRENGNFDYLMGADVDMSSDKVVEELIAWGKWYLDFTGVDGLRLDAVKHIDYSFYEKWLDAIRKDQKRNVFAVGEYWSGELEDLTAYLANSGDRMSLFDVPLHYNFCNAARSNGEFDMRNLFKNTLVATDIMRSVPFVDNHDSQPGQSLESWVEAWFKPLAYAAILLRRDGLPCVFYADYYGLPEDNLPPVLGLRRFLAARRLAAYGEQTDYFDHPDLIGWTRAGDGEHPNSGCAVVMTDRDGGEKTMSLGKGLAGRTLVDITRREDAEVTLDGDGNGTFLVEGGSVSVYVTRELFDEIAVNYE